MKILMDEADLTLWLAFGASLLSFVFVLSSLVSIVFIVYYRCFGKGSKRRKRDASAPSYASYLIFYAWFLHQRNRTKLFSMLCAYTLGFAIPFFIMTFFIGKVKWGSGFTVFWEGYILVIKHVMVIAFMIVLVGFAV